MKFKLVESFDTYYRITTVDDSGRELGGLFRGLYMLVNDLYENDDPSYYNINELLSKLEYSTPYPEKFENFNAIFAYKEGKYKEIYEDILDLKTEINKLGWDIVITKLDRPHNVVYEDTTQIAYII